MDLGKKNKQIFVKQISTSGWEQGGAHTDYENVFKIGNPGDGIFVSSEGDRFMISGGIASTSQLAEAVNVEITGVGITGSGLFIEKDQNVFLFRSVVGGSGIQLTGYTGDLVIDFTGKPSPEGQNIGTDSSATGLSGLFRGVDQAADGTNIFQFRSLSGAGNIIITGDTGRLIISGNNSASAGGGGGGGGGYTGHHIYSGGTSPEDSGIGMIEQSGFTGSFAQSFSQMMVTGDITGFSMSGMTTGAAATIMITCPTGNNVTFMNEFTFIGEKPVAFHSGKTGIMVFTSFGTGGPGIDPYQHNTVPSGVLVAYGVQD
jgi:hypothetical protein